MSDSNINMVAPEGVVGEGFFATKLNDVVGLARANSFVPPLQHLVAELNLWQQWLRIDLARFGSERVSFSPRQADMLMVMGLFQKKWRLFTSVYEQMSDLVG
jgi:NADH-quinone oxidoreductase subunit B